MIKPSNYKRIEETCYIMNPKGKVYGRNNRAQIYPDRNGNITDNGKEYNVKELFKTMFPPVV